MTNFKEKSISELTELYNKTVPADKRIKKFRDHSSAVERVTKLLSNGKSITVIGTPEKSKTKPVTIQHREKRMKEYESKIHLLVKENPRREGSEGWHNFNLYKEGMAVSDFKAAGGKSNHMAWDLKHKYIELK